MTGTGVAARETARGGPCAGMGRTFRALRNPNYRLYWFGLLISQTGTWMQQVAQAWLVLKLTGSALALGTITTVQFLPILCFALFGGVLADRLPKRGTLLVTQSVMLAQAAILTALTATGAIRLPHLYVLAAVLGLANAVDNPTRQAFVSELVGQEDLPNAVALNSTLFNATRIIGPAVGGVLIAAVGMAMCFGLNAVSYLAVLISLFLMRPEHFFAAPRRAHAGVLSAIGEGIRYALTTPDAALVLLLMAVLGIFGYNFNIILPLIARNVLHSNAAGYGSLTSAMGVGSLLAALSIAYLGKARRRTLFMGAAGFSLLLGALAATHLWALTVPLLVVLGFCSVVFTATANTRLQLVTPRELRGRVMSIYMLLFAGSAPIGGLLIGALAQRFGVQRATGLAAAVCVLGVVAALGYARRARARLAPEAAPAPTPAPPAPSTAATATSPAD